MGKCSGEKELDRIEEEFWSREAANGSLDVQGNEISRSNSSELVLRVVRFRGARRK